MLRNVFEVNKSNFNPEFKPIDISTKKILVLSLVKNCVNNFDKIYNFINRLSLIFKTVSFEYLTNNNTDNTVELLKSQHSENFHGVIHNDHKYNLNYRIDCLAYYRDCNFQNAISHYGLDFDYLCIFDSDMHQDIPIGAFENAFGLSDWSCISGNFCLAGTNIYYDQLALRFPYEDLDIQKTYPNFSKYYGISNDWHPLYVINNWIKVKAAFGGVSVYKFEEILEVHNKYGRLFDISKFPKYTAEHIALQSKLSGPIVINPNLRYY